MRGVVRDMNLAPLTALSPFRMGVYGAFDRRRDALFELLDALVSAGSVASLPHLSLQPSHRRGWGSLYDALAAGRIREGALRSLVAQ